MHPAIVIELAAARHAELLHAAESRHATRLVRTGSVRRPALTRLSTSAAVTTRRLRQRAAQLIALGTAQQSTLEPCC